MKIVVDYNWFENEVDTLWIIIDLKALGSVIDICLFVGKNNWNLVKLIQMCEAIDSSKREKDRLGKLYEAANIYYNYSGNAKCFNLNDHSDPHGLGGWQWQVLYLSSQIYYIFSSSKSNTSLI